MSETMVSPRIQAWLDVMPSEAPDRLFDAVLDETANVSQLRPRIGLLGLGAQRGRRALVLVVVALLLVALAAAAGMIAGLPKPGPHDYANQVVAARPLSVARAHPVLVRLADGRVLVMGGSDAIDAPAAEIVDPATAIRVSIGAPAAGEALRAAYAGALLPDGRVFALAPGEAWAFDPAASSFEPLPGMTVPRDGAAMVVLADGRVLISGGFIVGDPGNSLPSAETFDPATGRFTAAPGVMDYGRQDHVMVALSNGTALVLGGQTRIDGGNIGNSQLEAFHPLSGTFSNLSIGVGTSTRPVALPDGRLVLFDAPQPYQVKGNFAIYDPASRTIGPSRPLPHVVNAALLLDDGRVLLVGAEGNGNLVGMFDPATESLADGPWLASWSPSAVRLPDGRVLLVGGFASPEPGQDGVRPAVRPPAVSTIQIFW